MQDARFTFARIKYTSGNWDTDQRMPANLLNSLLEYTTIPLNEEEKIVELGSNDLFKYPFCYLSGHKLVQFNQQEARNFKTYGAGAVISTALMSGNANALDVSTALTGADAEANIETGALWALGIVVVIYGAKKVIGFFGR